MGMLNSGACCITVFQLWPVNSMFENTRYTLSIPYPTMCDIFQLRARCTTHGFKQNSIDYSSQKFRETFNFTFCKGKKKAAWEKHKVKLNQSESSSQNVKITLSICLFTYLYISMWNSHLHNLAGWTECFDPNWVFAKEIVVPVSSILLKTKDNIIYKAQRPFWAALL